ncbi:hypothetical protein OE88DRAFT_1643093 [Heliocybe sulcata]|uniref:Uncharacterized protein n=1 Tax=Heliocybe sulcata TaxID=5364 RepID=A0A5C3N883_9AGAM|nr:hypothetical protein OE88DRAFT_1643093 [Heliocybe sulcata]
MAARSGATKGIVNVRRESMNNAKTRNSGVWRDTDSSGDGNREQQRSDEIRDTVMQRESSDAELRWEHSLEGERRLYWRPRLFTLAASSRLYSPQRGDTLSIQRDSMQTDLFWSRELFLDSATMTHKPRPPDLSDRINGNSAQHRPVGPEESRPSSHSRSTIPLNVPPVVPIIAFAARRVACSGCPYASTHRLHHRFRLPPRDASLARPTTPFGTTAPLFGNYARHSSYCGTAALTQGLVRRGVRTRLVARFKLGYECTHAGTAP